MITAELVKTFQALGQAKLAPTSLSVYISHSEFAEFDCSSAILNLLNLTVTMETTASTLISFRDNARCSLIHSKNDNNKRMHHVIKILVFQTTVSIV